MKTPQTTSSQGSQMQASRSRPRRCEQSAAASTSACAWRLRSCLSPRARVGSAKCVSIDPLARSSRDRLFARRSRSRRCEHTCAVGDEGNHHARARTQTRAVHRRICPQRADEHEITREISCVCEDVRYDAGARARRSARVGSDRERKKAAKKEGRKRAGVEGEARDEAAGREK
eukprot:6180820-Pleurochrysis_carterae.AAC.1